MSQSDKNDDEIIAYEKMANDIADELSMLEEEFTYKKKEFEKVCSSSGKKIDKTEQEELDFISSHIVSFKKDLDEIDSIIKQKIEEQQKHDKLYGYDDVDELDIPIMTARDVVITEFQKRFFNKDGSANEEFTSNFSDKYKKWSDVVSIINDDALYKFGPPDNESYQDGNTTTFTGRIFGLYTEVTVTDNGKVKKCYFEID
ncbi:MAG: hypothetical protein MK207_01950 [Saprospiraceae bacterium]|nr:hypothetical protein [Saprospiraceae bacterium]